MTERLVTDRELRDLLRELRTLRTRVAAVEVTEKTTYAFGTFVPTYFGATTAGVTTYTTQEGQYIRKGSEITVWGKLVWTAATGTGVIRLGGLPFTPAYDAAFTVRTVNVTFANGSIQGILQAGNVVAQLFSPATNAGGTELVIEAAGTISYQITYHI